MESSSHFPSGTILFLKDYIFNDGNSSDKILIILCSNSNDSAIIYSLTTSKARLPQEFEKHGCQESNDTDVSVYVFEANKVVGFKNYKENKFSFDLNTFLFLRDNIVEVPITKLNPYISSGRLSNLGRLYSSELKSLLSCINNSDFVKRGMKSKIFSYLLASELDY